MDKAKETISTAVVLPCQTKGKIGECLGSKYRFCVPQNRRPDVGNVAHGKLTTDGK